ncbi:MAG: ribosome small subunit-dependent GTPase A, partial [Actinomycetes bacterium]
VSQGPSVPPSNDELRPHLSSHPPTPLEPPLTGRLARVDRGAVDVLLEGTHERVRAELGPAVKSAAAADASQQPVVGDRVSLRTLDEGRRLVHSIHPRGTAITRASVTPGSSQRQVLAANMDLVAVIEPVNAAPRPGRIERLLALGWESGAQPLLVLTKADLAVDLDASIEVARDNAPGVDVIICSSAWADGVAMLRERLLTGTVVAFIGPSGAGKSTLVNLLAQHPVMETAEVRSDHRGRHTTVHRELIVLPGGAMVIDTPGLRSVGLASSEALDQVFADLEELATACRFSDCVHETEPGCAVLSAIETGVLDERRLVSWRKLQREAAWLERRADARLRAAERAKWRTRARELRSQQIRP